VDITDMTARQDGDQGVPTLVDEREIGMNRQQEQTRAGDEPDQHGQDKRNQQRGLNVDAGYPLRLSDPLPLVELTLPTATMMILVRCQSTRKAA